MRIARAHGSTLLELLIAVAVFALLAAAGFSGVNALSRATETQQQQARLLESVQKAVLALDRDLQSAIDRPVRVAGLSQPGFVGNSREIRLTQAAWSNPLAQPRSELQRIGWQLSGNQLSRITHWVLDSPSAGESQSQVLLAGIEQLDIRYADNSYQWHSEWPAAGSQGLPRAVRYSFTVPGIGLVQRLLPLPGPRS